MKFTFRSKEFSRFVLFFTLCFIIGFSWRLLLNNRVRGDATVIISYFKHTGADIQVFNTRVREYLDSKSIKNVACYAVPRPNGIDVVVVDERPFGYFHKSIHKELVAFYVGYASAVDDIIPGTNTIASEFYILDWGIGGAP